MECSSVGLPSIRYFNCSRRKVRAKRGQASMSASLARDVASAFAGAGGALALTRSFEVLASKGFMKRELSRKCVHVLSGPLFAATWPIYSDSALAPAFATVVPGIQVVKLLAVGSGLVRDEDAVRSISRGGDAKELLRGPLYYAVVLTLLTCIYWRSSPCGILTISLLCGGDGLADILGRALKGPKLPWNASKTYAGTLSMLFAGGSLAGLFYLVFSASGCLHVDASEFTRLTICASLAATFAESLPINKLIDDNISVPVATLAVCYLFGA